MMNLPPFGAPIPIDAPVASMIVIVVAPALKTVLLASGAVVAIVAGAAWRALRGRRSARHPARAGMANVAEARG
jgi:hypothetical protein